MAVRIIGSLALLCVLSGSGWAEDSGKRFQLFAACLPMRVFVVMTKVPHAWKPIKQEIQKIIEEPLQQLNLYKAPDSYSNFIVLRISGNESGLVFIELEYHKMLSDLASDLVSLSPTWRMHKIFTLLDQQHQQLVEAQIKVNAHGLILKFFPEYLEANMEQCRTQLPAKAFKNWRQYFNEKQVAPLGALD